MTTIDLPTLPPAAAAPVAPVAAHGTLLRSFVIALTAFLTVVDLFATQAILPSLAKSYGVTPSAIGFAVNASTIGMAIAGLAVSFFSDRIDRRRGILFALIALSVPTALLAVASDLTTFAILRVVQGLLMSTAFALTLSHLAEHCSARDTAGAFAAYITGNVASNLFGRLLSAALTDHLGLAGNFVVFAALNLAGAALVYCTLGRTPPMPLAHAAMDSALPPRSSPFAVWSGHLRNPALRAAFAIGFLILFAFIGTFTYVNFVLVREPLSLSRMAVGFVYFVFLPSLITTPLAGRAVARFGVRTTFWGGIAVALAGLPLLSLASLPPILLGLAAIGAGTFFAQATATGFVGRAAAAGGNADGASASGLYLACYFAGGIAGSLVLGQLFDRSGWTACVAGIGLALLAAALLGARLRLPAARASTR
jgi:predicted MFS family arabinose efflux permease